MKDPTRRPSATDVSRRAAALAQGEGQSLGAPLPLPDRRVATATWSGPAPQASAPSISGPPSPRRAQSDDDAVTGRIPVARREPGPVPASPPPTRSGPSFPGPPFPGSPHSGPSLSGPPPAPPAPRRRRWGRTLAGLAVLAVLAMVAGGFLTYRYGPTRTITAPPTTVTVTAPAPTASVAPSATPPSVAAPTGVPPLFLGQVQEVSSTTTLTKQGYGINGNFYPLSINVATYTSTSPEPSGIDYLLNRQYRTFTTVFGIADTFSDLGSQNATPPSCTLQVFLDDRPLTPTQTATRQTPLQLQNLDVSGGLRLRLVMTQTGTSGSSSSSTGSTEYPCTLGNPMVAG